MNKTEPKVSTPGKNRDFVDTCLATVTMQQLSGRYRSVGEGEVTTPVDGEMSFYLLLYDDECRVSE